MTPSEGNKIEGSPLLNNNIQNPKPPAANSTINIDKLDKTRFSEMKEGDGENNSLRIIIYVLIVIVIGVGLALLVRQLISNQQVESPQSNSQTPVSEPVIETNPALIINTIGLPDASASNVGSNEDYVDSTLVSLGSTDVNMNVAKLDKIQYTDYETFSRLVFDLSTTENKLPKVNLSFDSSKSTLTVEFVGIKNIDTNLQKDLTIGGVIDEIRFDQVNKKYIIFLADNIKYRVVSDGDNLVIDFKTQKALEQSTNAETPTTNDTNTTTEDTTTDNSDSMSSDTSKPAAPHYENSFSQSKQYVSSALNTNSITLNNYYVWDEGSFFEFSWAEEGKLGDDYVPNANAYLETKDGVNYIVVEIDNLKSANLADGLTPSQIESKSGISMAGANFAGLTRDSFDSSTGKAIYRIELNKKANFKLLDQTTYDEKTQILSIQIKD